MIIYGQKYGFLGNERHNGHFFPESILERSSPSFLKFCTLNSKRSGRCRQEFMPSFHKKRKKRKREVDAQNTRCLVSTSQKQQTAKKTLITHSAKHYAEDCTSHPVRIVTCSASASKALPLPGLCLTGEICCCTAMATACL